MKHEIVTVTNKTYPWSFLIQTLCNRLPNHDGDNKLSK
jgi:hypothetical protein